MENYKYYRKRHTDIILFDLQRKIGICRRRQTRDKHANGNYKNDRHSSSSSK